MAKIQPLPAASSSPSSADERQSRLQPRGEQVFTVWMKSLVFGGNGCTVYGADGRVAFRVDNYGCRGGREVFFMDRDGKTLIRIQRKSFGVFKRWEARRYFDGGEEERPWFTLHKARKGGAAVTMHGGGRMYTVEGCSRKSDYKISGAGGAGVAAIARKQTASGIVLGEDVLTLTLGSEVDHLLVLGMVVVCGLMNRCM
ncbi:protein LURP-one-related 11-like [Panicum virgatum]|uniref:protein LURP-one-related 11-like n=1 Tax=Panicum virgatum TaxID=38727 RepID=UPI0019D55820|nr:protein LURP-one-related 11-like [Panicum virgatum]